MKNVLTYKLFEAKSTVMYHGGENKLTNDNLEDRPIFTTPNKEGALWYVYRVSEDGSEKGWLTKMYVDFKKPLNCNNVDDFITKWIPILDESNIEYTFENDKNGWSFESYDIIKNGGYIENNIYDLIYIDKFVEVAKKHGYDGMIGYDVLENGEIEIYVPFYKKCIDVISSEQI